MPVFNQLAGGGRLTNATVRNYIETGQVGELANYYQTDGLNGSVNFYTNPYALGCNTVSNFSNSSFDALQFELRRNVKEGVDVGANYTWSKVLSDAAGNDQSRFEPFLDFNNTKIERARAPFDLTHSIKADVIYDLPLGKGHRLNNSRLERLLGGWKASGIMTWNSGGPVSIISGYATLNRASRSTGIETADSSLTKPQLDSLLQFRMNGDGPYFMAASAIGQDGRGVDSPGTPAFSGQAFFNPGAGTVGTLQKRMFSGPWTFDLDAAVIKEIAITENHSIELRMESTNILNHPSWLVGDQNINDPTFGRIASTVYGPAPDPVRDALPVLAMPRNYGRTSSRSPDPRCVLDALVSPECGQQYRLLPDRPVVDLPGRHGLSRAGRVDVVRRADHLASLPLALHGGHLVGRQGGRRFESAPALRRGPRL